MNEHAHQMERFVWSADYSVSVARFDAAHRKIFDYVAELYDALASREARAKVEQILEAPWTTP